MPSIGRRYFLQHISSMSLLQQNAVLPHRKYGVFDYALYEPFISFESEKYKQKNSFFINTYLLQTSMFPY